MKKLLYLIVLSATATLHAGMKLPALFSDGMVLQRDTPLRVWGWSDPGETVTVSLDGNEASGSADDSGKWLVELAPMPAGGPFRLTASAVSGSAVRDDVMIGEVWLAGGQSNMEWPLKKADGAAEAIASCANPRLRFFRVPYRLADRPLEDLADDPGQPSVGHWTECTPETAPDFSAVGYFFGRELQASLNIPVGIISAHWGGTAIEPWTSAEGFRTVPALSEISRWVDTKIPGTALHAEVLNQAIADQSRWLAEAEAARDHGTIVPNPPDYPEALRPLFTSGHPWQPTCLYNAMIHPLVPYSMRGAIWYQGCSNVDQGMLYADKLEALYRGWSASFRNPDFGFYLSQLAPFIYDGNPECLPELMEAQAAYEKRNPRAHMAVINDIGNPRDIHPTDKRDVGERLAALALKYEYGRDDIACDFAQATGFEVDGSRLVVNFDQQLATSDGKAPDWFEIAGPDGVFYPAQATLSGDRVILSASEVSRPVIVHFGRRESAEPHLRNVPGLPVGSFRFGEIPERSCFDEVVADADRAQRDLLSNRRGSNRGFRQPAEAPLRQDRPGKPGILAV